MLWALSGLWTLERGWVWESWKYLPGGGLEYRRNYFDLDRKPLFIAMSVLLAAFAISRFRQASKPHFALFQLACGFMGAYLTLRVAPIGSMASWLALVGSLTLCATGFENLLAPTPPRGKEPGAPKTVVAAPSAVKCVHSSDPTAQDEDAAEQGDAADGKERRR